MRRLAIGILSLLVVALVATAYARVVRPAPNFGWIDYNGQQKTLESLRGQPVVLLIASSPTNRAFRAQVGQLQKIYQRFAAQKLVCFAAFTDEGGTIKSNIPFVVASDGPRVAFLYEVSQRFAIAIIGPDGNLDYITTKVVPAQRIMDIMDANFDVQRQLRSEQELPESL